MPLPVPNQGTFTTGVTDTAAFLNANVRDSVTFLTNPPICVCYAGVVQSIPNNAWTGLLMNTNRVDSYSGHSVSVNTNRYVAQVAGWYHVVGIGAAASANIDARLAVNAVPVLGSAQSGGTTGGAGLASASGQCLVFLNIGDFVECQFYQLSGGALNTSATGTDFTSSLQVLWIHA